MYFCPVCAGQSTVTKQLPAQYLSKALADFVEADETKDVDWKGYELCECQRCSLQFSMPMEPAADDLYRWLDLNGDYYTDERWEWGVVEGMVAKAAADGPVSVLEFGAGAGFLLQRLKRVGATRVVAVERSDMAVERLQAEDIEAVRADQAESYLTGSEFDFVFSFHCLEHVADPLAFMLQKRRFAGPNGRLLVSVPYSPMHFETRMFDPLNHPPHHMTRWNAEALNGLAINMNEAIVLHSPKAFGLVRRVRHAVACETLGPKLHKYTRLRRWLAVMRPVAVVVEIWRQLRRDRIAGRVAGDVVLAELTRK